MGLGRVLMTIDEPTLGHAFSTILRADPDRSAVIDTGGLEVRMFSYAELDRMMDRVAAAASASGLVPGDVAAVVLRNRLEFVFIVFGLMRAGIVPALVNPRLKADDLLFMLRDCGAKIAFTDDWSKPATDKIWHALSGVERVELTEEGGPALDRWLDGGTEAPPFSAGPDDVALIIYTSGSTGRPKGVRLPHRDQLQHFSDQKSYYAKVYCKPPVNLVAAPMFHKNGTGMVKTAFVTGGTIVIMPRFDAPAFIKNIERYRVTTFAAVAAMLNMMMAEKALLDRTDLSSLDAIMVGAAPSGKVLLDEVRKTFGARVYHMFGTTESGATLGHDPDMPYTLDSCGRPLPGVEVKLVDPDTGRDDAERGELYVRGPGLALGYHDRPETEAARFRDGWYATGDILRRDKNGFFFFRGRLDDMFVCGGENVYPREVERQLLNHPNVAQAFIGPIPHAVKGQAPAAIVVPRGNAPDERVLQDFYAERAPSFSIPRFVFFAERFPLAPTGKVDVKALQIQLEAAAAERMEAA